MEGYRCDGRESDALRSVRITDHYLMYAEGSALIEVGQTRVICTASVEDQTAKHLKGTGKGWITAEYSMLPRSTKNRKQRDISRGKLDGRSSEIQRLIGRSLRACVDLEKLGERTIRIDCDVIQADGGTRTASITGAFVAMVQSIQWMKEQGWIWESPLRCMVSAVSVGLIGEEALLDLCYQEDSQADVDMNVVMTDTGQFVEIQGTGEEAAFSKKQLSQLLSLAEAGCRSLNEMQRQILAEALESLCGIEDGDHIVVAATQNSHKITEMESITEPFGLKIISREEAGIPPFEVEEDGDTFEANSEKKALEIMRACGRVTIADDSGLEVDALDGAPGVYSARFSSEHATDQENNEKLLSLLAHVPEEERGAQFVSVITMVWPNGEKIVARGECRGHILYEPQGENGFGYDPLFVPDGFDRSFAQLTAEEKNQISHRAIALQDLKRELEKRKS